MFLGTDEHGLKIENAALSAGKNALDFCNTISHNFKHMFTTCDIGFTRFIRTTDKEHTFAVQHFLQTLYDKGYIYKDLYEGWYCVSDEAFLTDKQIIKKKLTDGSTINISSESGHPVEWNRETNYIFKLNLFQNDLMKWLEKEGRVIPERFHQELKQWVQRGITNLSISRPKSRNAWGIPLPWDKEHTTYVWVDALVNYLTAAGYPNIKTWPPNLQVIGKDILRFHGIYWPALLMAADLEPPNKLHVHSHWIVNDLKMSKSIGNVLCPAELSQKYSVDGVRYLLLRNGVPHSDCCWNNEKFIRDINAELANVLGNLINRLTPNSLNPHQIFPPIDFEMVPNSSVICKPLISLMNNFSDIVKKHYLDCNFYEGIAYIMRTLRTTNEFINEQKPWQLQNNIDDRNRLDFVLSLGLTAVTMAGIALQPIIPNLADNLLNILGVLPSNRSWVSLKTIFERRESSKLGAKSMFFNKIKS